MKSKALFTTGTLRALNKRQAYREASEEKQQGGPEIKYRDTLQRRPKKRKEKKELKANAQLPRFLHQLPYNNSFQSPLHIFILLKDNLGHQLQKGKVKKKNQTNMNEVG